MKLWEPNFGIVELCLTYRCNVKCDNCSNLCTQAPFKGDLTPERVSEFLIDSEENEHSWGMITIHGGEPVLNPHIDKIVEMLVDYRLKTGCKLWLLTNNSSDDVRHKVTSISVRHDISLGISTKRGKNITDNGSPIEYVPVNDSPEDRGIEHDMGCFQTSNCGVCYNYLGYFPCSPMAAAARVFGLAPVAQSFSDFTAEKCKEMMEKYCGHCGFSAPNRPRIIKQITTKTWQDAFDLYRRTHIERNEE